MKPLYFLFCSLLLLVVTSLFSTLYAQKPGNIEIIQDDRVAYLVQKHVELNEKQLGFPGYRVQIFFASGNNSKNRALAVRNEFAARFPNVEAYLIFQEPNYKVRVGDFRTRLEAQGFTLKIIGLYPNAYPVKDEIKLPPID